MRRDVVFPLPLEPTRPTISPGSTDSDSPVNASRGPYRFASDRTSSTRSGLRAGARRASPMNIEEPPEHVAGRFRAQGEQGFARHQSTMQFREGQPDRRRACVAEPVGVNKDTLGLDDLDAGRAAPPYARSPDAESRNQPRGGRYPLKRQPRRRARKAKCPRCAPARTHEQTAVNPDLERWSHRRPDGNPPGALGRTVRKTDASGHDRRLRPEVPTPRPRRHLPSARG